MQFPFLSGIGTASLSCKGIITYLLYRGIIIAARADACKPYDIVSCFFAPVVKIAEDPVTGSTHCCIASYFSQILRRMR
ncbi:MAG: PhzF family phenazine biosynthesis protein [Methanospirillaceae archaeon]|nr:PhzF family phenazine biosynthesis protein [Methanospirillaceae archaeon]